MLFEDPPPGISAWFKEDDSREIEAVVNGAEGTPYADGRFRLQLSIPQRYPFEPPKVHYVTPIYHPNIDSAGRICLDTLNMPPKGAWKPSLNIGTVLKSLQLLMSEPNPDDGLMVDITHQYINDYARFERTAREHTRKHAMGSGEAGPSDAAASSASSAAEDDAAPAAAAAASAAEPPPPPQAGDAAAAPAEGAAAPGATTTTADVSDPGEAAVEREADGGEPGKRPRLE